MVRIIMMWRWQCKNPYEVWEPQSATRTPTSTDVKNKSHSNTLTQHLIQLNNRQLNAGTEREHWPVVAHVWSIDGSTYCGCIKYHAGRQLLSAWSTYMRGRSNRSRVVYLHLIWTRPSKDDKLKHIYSDAAGRMYLLVCWFRFCFLVISM